MKCSPNVLVSVSNSALPTRTFGSRQITEHLEAMGLANSSSSFVCLAKQPIVAPSAQTLECSPCNI
jgi:hypothetical protein